MGVVERPLKKLRSSSGSRNIEEDFRSTGPATLLFLSLYLYVYVYMRYISLSLSIITKNTQKEREKIFRERDPR